MGKLLKVEFSRNGRASLGDVDVRILVDRLSNLQTIDASTDNELLHGLQRLFRIPTVAFDEALAGVIFDNRTVRMSGKHGTIRLSNARA